MVLPWKAGNYLGLGDGNVFVIARILDVKIRVQGEDYPSPFGLVSFATAMWNKVALLSLTQPAHVRTSNNLLYIG